VSAEASRKHVVVIGGGITGLTASYRLCRAVQTHDLPFDVTLLEASDRLGGVIATDQTQDFLLERGPDCFISSKPWGIQLCEELELGEQLIGTTTQHRQSFIVRHGKLIPVPQGLYLMVPGSLWAFARSPILSWRGKLRMGLDLLLPRRVSPDDESLTQFVTRRLGREALERLAQPMVGGIYTADPQYLSLQATMPQFLEMEQRHGSLIRAMLRNRRTSQHGASVQDTSGPRYGLFVSFQQGMYTLVHHLAAGLPHQTVRLHARVRGLQWQPQAARWRVRVHDQPDLQADALCLALPAPQASQLLAEVDPDLSSVLRDIPYASSATVNVAYRREQVSHPLNGMGFVVPAVEQRTLMACSFSSVKFAGRAPAAFVLLRAFVGGALQPEQYERSDHAMQHAVCQDLQQLLGITGKPTHLSVSRHPHSMPQYHLGHVQRVARIEVLTSRFPGLVLAGNAYRGVGIPDCIHSGESAAQALVAYLTTSPERYSPVV
jgi:oxygen-dependent protoporphyrinogen oxidase